jgi:hypothetical protein
VPQADVQISDEYDRFNEAHCITQSTMDDGQVLFRLDDDKTLARELRTYLQTEKYVKIMGRAAFSSRTTERSYGKWATGFGGSTDES